MKNTLRKILMFIKARGFWLSWNSTSEVVDTALTLIWPVKTDFELIRVGSDKVADGGYLVPDDIDGIAKVFSPGVASSIEFEKFFLNRDIPCELIDGSIENPPEAHPLLSFQQKWLGPATTNDAVALSDWVNNNSKPNDDLLLQMDIEGAEYETILASDSQILSRFRIIVIELHDLSMVLNPHGNLIFKLFMIRLLQNHVVVHAHPNNCCIPVRRNGLVWPNVLELTLLRKDRVGNRSNELATLPNPLDLDNTGNPTITLRLPRRKTAK